ncbi:MAG: CCA tRNA nucleotidyltransferase [Rhodospirillaceae bacterium]|nr:CCA tRNA nucleotidyltransferase [Rhodospirillaceae bacterium]
MTPGWLTSREAVRLFEALGAPAVDARVVGGCVRNHVMGFPVGEIDAATPETPDAVMQRLANAGVRVIPTGLDHGTVTALIGDRSFEITSLRRDTACDGRHAAVEFTRDWKEDARRRDFTFNAMSMRGDGELFDYFGGLGDAEAGRVKFVGDPGDRIQEDYLRILRLFRFYAWYGRTSLDSATLAACRTHAHGLTRLSVERVQSEIIKTLAAPAPAQVLTLMQGCGVLTAILPEITDLSRLAALARVESAVAASTDWRRRLAACVTESDAEALAQRLKFSAADRLRLVRLTAAEPRLDAATPAAQVRAALYRHGSDMIYDRVLLAWALARTRGGADDGWMDQLGHVAAWRPRSLPVSGADVLALGIPQSPRVGQILGAVEAWWIARDFAPSREDTLQELRRQAAKL